jgi:hypothetical protein
MASMHRLHISLVFVQQQQVIMQMEQYKLFALPANMLLLCVSYLIVLSSLPES